jgi:hypothetical protein
MTESASLTMLKNAGAKAKAVDAELDKSAETPAAPSTAADEVTVDVDKMSSKELDQLALDQLIKTPDGWTSWDAPAKRDWLKKTFGDDGEEAKLETVVAAEESIAKDAAAEVDKADADKAGKKAGKKKTASKAVAPSTVKEGEIVEPDLLQDLVHKIETTKEKEALAQIEAELEKTEVATFMIGGLLSLVQANGWYAPFASFREFVEANYCIGYRKAMYWIDIYNRLSNAGIPWAKVKDLGWTKLQIIAAVLTQENVDEWVGVAKSQNTVTLIETVKNAKAKAVQQSITDETSKTVTTMSFKVHEDQKATIEAAIEKAKVQSGTDTNTVALEFICLDFMGGTSLVDTFKKLGPEKVFKAVDQAFPTLNVDVTMPDDGAEAQAAE